MNIRMIKALYKKEITDILRDKKTILMMVVVPLILYPLIFIVSLYFAQSVMTESTSKTFVIEIENYDKSGELEKYFLDNQSKFDYAFAFYSEENGDGLANLEANKTSAFVQRTVSDNGVQYFTININASNNASQTAAEMVRAMLNDYNKNLSKSIISSYGLEAETVLNPIKYSVNNIASNEKTVGNLFGYIVPYLLISSVLMGAMYPAIDVTSGEKERGTLETLLTLPVKNLEMILSKFFATATIASGTAFLNVFSMGIIGYYLYSVVEVTGSIGSDFDVSLYIPAILLTLVLAIIFAMLSSAVCLSVCIFARSFKEAQNYTTPIMLVFMFAGMAALIPSIELNGKITLVPVVNFAILISKIFKLEYDFAIIARVIVINLSYTLLAIIFMTKVFSSENILFGDGSGSIKIIERRSEMKEKSIPGIGDVILLFSVILILLFSIGSLLVLKHGIKGAIVQQILIGVLPVLYCCYIKTDFKSVFRLKMPRLVHIIAAVITWAGAFIVMEIVSVFLANIFPESYNSADDAVNLLITDSSTLLIIIAVAVMPAICEELAFRGLLFGTLSKKYKIWPAIIISGLIFGIYHGNLIKTFVVGFLGMTMAYVIYNTDSIFVSMIMHFLNNFIAIALSLNADFVAKYIPALVNNDMGIGEIAGFSMAGLILFVIGILVINKTSRIKTSYENNA